jgi:membrane protease YdiL (CAAX protease family)
VLDGASGPEASRIVREPAHNTLRMIEPPVPRLRLGVLLWTAGMLGVAAVTLTVLPRLATEIALPAPLWVISIASLLQSALLVALATWAGVALAPAVGLHAPVFEAAAARRPIAPALAPQLLPGLIAGVLGGLLLFVVSRSLPEALASVQQRFNPPVAARMLYGGITEEVLLRWGVMTALVWLAWRFIQRRRSPVPAASIWIAIAVSAVLFGVGHLPVASTLVGTLDRALVLFVIGANAAFGALFGWLFWRRGLESAMIAHAVAHLVNYLIGLIA